MVEDNSLSVPRRPLEVDDYVDILRRQAGWIVGPTFAAIVIAVVVAFLWPDTYVSTALVRVVPPQVPEKFVPTNVNLEMSQRIQAMAQQILSRSTLTNVITTYGLYPRDRARLPMEDVVENMRKNDVRINNVVSVNVGEGRRQVPAFQITYSYEDRVLAQKVCQDLVSRFITENTRDRANQSVFTTQFLNDQLESARRDLEAVENRLAAFRVANSGRLPDQVQQNISQMAALEQRQTNLQSVISRAGQEKLLLESQLQILKDQFNNLSMPSEQPPTAKVQAKNERLAALEREILSLETQIAAMKESYKEAHPDVQRQLATLGVLKNRRDQMLKEEEDAAKKLAANEPAAAPARPNPLASREARELEANIRRVQGLIEAKDLEIENARKESVKVNDAVKETQARIAATPLGEKEYMDLLRERELVVQRVEQLNKSKSMSAIATDLERRQQGETLELLDPASLPQKPTDPNRAMIVGVGAALGLMAGLFFAGAREIKDTSLKNLKDVRAYTQLNILGSIPLLENDLVVKRRRRLSWLAWSTACIIGILIMSGSMYYYYFVAKS